MWRRYNAAQSFARTPTPAAPRTAPVTVNQSQRIEVRLRGQTREAITKAATEMGVQGVRFYAMRNGKGFHGYGYRYV